MSIKGKKKKLGVFRKNLAKISTGVSNKSAPAPGNVRKRLGDPSRDTIAIGPGKVCMAPAVLNGRLGYLRTHDGLDMTRCISFVSPKVSGSVWPVNEGWKHKAETTGLFTRLAYTGFN